MRERLRDIILTIKESLWFIPTVMSFSAMMLAFLLIEVDSYISYDDLPARWFLYAGNRSGARSVLSTIAASMATIAGVTFSMTLVTLTLASSQYGPRLLRKFITDKGNQMVLGTFVATFVYSLIVLLTIKESDDTSFIPKFSILFGFLLAVYSLGVLIYFIHHAAASIQAENVIRTSFNDLIDAVEKFMVDKQADDLSLEKVLKNINLDNCEQQTIRCLNSGYLQRINYKLICQWAAENDAVVRLLVKTGDFCTVLEPQFYLYHRGKLPENWKEEIEDWFELGSKRTPVQEIRFSIKQIVEVAVRALSPGINDPHTAISAIHYLGAVLVTIGTRYFRSIVIKDKKQNIRIIERENSFGELLDACFDHLRVYARSNIFVATEMLMAIEKASRHTIHRQMQEALRQKASLIMDQLRMEEMTATDFKKAEAVYENILESYNRFTVRSVAEPD